MGTGGCDGWAPGRDGNLAADATDGRRDATLALGRNGCAITPLKTRQNGIPPSCSAGPPVFPLFTRRNVILCTGATTSGTFSITA